MQQRRTIHTRTRPGLRHSVESASSQTRPGETITVVRERPRQTELHARTGGHRSSVRARCRFPERELSEQAKSTGLVRNLTSFAAGDVWSFPDPHDDWGTDTVLGKLLGAPGLPLTRSPFVRPGSATSPGAPIIQAGQLHPGKARPGCRPESVVSGGTGDDGVVAGLFVERLGGHVESVRPGDGSELPIDIDLSEHRGSRSGLNTPNHSQSPNATSPIVPSSNDRRSL